MAQRRSSSEIILLVGLTIICALLVCDLGSAILGRDSASLFPGKNASYQAELLYVQTALRHTIA